MAWTSEAETLHEAANRLPRAHAGTFGALVEQYDDDLARCAPKADCPLPATYFKQLKALRSLPRWEQVRQVDAWVNGFPYRAVTGPGDTVAKFLKEGGSCKEYVLTKFVMLRDLGFGLQNLWPAIVRQPTGGYHQLLLVKLDGATLVLSNFLDKRASEPASIAFSPFRDYPVQWIVRLPDYLDDETSDVEGVSGYCENGPQR